MEKPSKIIQIDGITGEVLDGVVSWVPAKRHKYLFQKGWFVMFQEAIGLIAEMNLSKDAHRVFNFLLAHMNFDNYVALPQSVISKRLSIQKSHVSEAIKELKGRNIILTSNNGPGRTMAYRINSHTAWKGEAENLAKVRPIDPKITTNQG